MAMQPKAFVAETTAGRLLKDSKGVWQHTGHHKATVGPIQQGERFVERLPSRFQETWCASRYCESCWPCTQLHHACYAFLCWTVSCQSRPELFRHLIKAHQERVSLIQWDLHRESVQLSKWCPRMQAVGAAFGLMVLTHSWMAIIISQGFWKASTRDSWNLAAPRWSNSREKLLHRWCTELLSLFCPFAPEINGIS
jgi:hypothetical protein